MFSANPEALLMWMIRRVAWLGLNRKTAAYLLSGSAAQWIQERLARLLPEIQIREWLAIDLD